MMFHQKITIYLSLVSKIKIKSIHREHQYKDFIHVSRNIFDYVHALRKPHSFHPLATTLTIGFSGEILAFCVWCGILYNACSDACSCDSGTFQRTSFQRDIRFRTLDNLTVNIHLSTVNFFRTYAI